VLVIDPTAVYFIFTINMIIVISTKGNSLQGA